MWSRAKIAAIMLAGYSFGGCSQEQPEPPPGELEKFVARIDAKTQAEHAELVKAARAREEERARQSEERLRQLEKAPPAALESAVKSINR